MPDTDCALCRKQKNSYQDLTVYENDFWLLRHSQETNILGYFVIESKRHFLDLSEATANEASSYGVLLALAMKGMHSIIECQRIYTFSLAEMVPHFHVHLIPKTESLPRFYRGRGIMSYPTQPAADKSLVQQVCQSMRLALRRLS